MSELPFGVAFSEHNAPLASYLYQAEAHKDAQGWANRTGKKCYVVRRTVTVTQETLQVVEPR